MTMIRGADLDFHELPGRRAADPLAGLAAPVSVRVVEIDPGVDRSPHRHPMSSEVVYVVEGRGVVWLDGKTAPVAAGDVVFIPAQLPHATIALDARMRLVCFFPHPDLAGNLEELAGPIVL